jgi:Electron transfer DM13
VARLVSSLVKPSSRLHGIENDAPDNASVQRAGFIDLGTIKGNIGDQNYTLPRDVDLSKYEAVSVWCERFRVNFGAAPLRTDHPAYQR